ncbi:MAG TPA: O-antigen ligase family protein, partial [Candidatus Paceibacterota bacterium]|nr:O-antigen ligase family protein [Candidatus Paceibacterota bacterium]
KNKLLTSWYLLLIISNIIILYYTATRGAILGFIGGVILTCLLLAIFKSGQTRKIAGGLVIVALLLIGGFISIKNTDFIQQSPVLSRFASISLTETTVGSRMMVWRMSWQGFKERPILGWGPENYSLVFSKYYDPKMYGQEPWFDRSHNIFFDWLINAGLLGLLAYLSVYLISLYYLWFGWKPKEDKKGERDFATSVVASSLLTGLLAGYFFHNIFVFDNLISYILFFSLIAFIHITTTKKEEEKNLAVKKDYQAKKNNNQEIALIPTVGAIVVVVVLVWCLYILNYQPYKVSVDLIRAIHPQTSVADSLTILKSVFARKTFGSGEAREQLVVKTINTLNDANVSNEAKKVFVALVAEQIREHQTHFANDARSNLLFGSYLTMLGQSDEGLAFLQKALTEAPKKQQILFELGNAYVRRQDANNAIKVTKEAYELEPAYTEARKMYALICLMTNQIALANELLLPIKKEASYYDDERFVDVYTQMGNQIALQEIIDLREKNK